MIQIISAQISKSIAIISYLYVSHCSYSIHSFSRRVCVRDTSPFDPRDAKRRKLSGKKEKLLRKIKELEGQLLNARQEYHSCDLEERELLSSLGVLQVNESNPQTSPDRNVDDEYINVIIGGKVGCLPPQEILYLSDIKSAIANTSQATVFGCNYRHANLGTREFLIPPGVTTLPTNKWGKYQAAAEHMNRLYDLMRGEQCSLSKGALYHLGLACHTNSGGSDEASINIINATCRALFNDMGIPESKISNLQIAKAMPSRTTIRSIDLKLGLSCFLAICHEIFKDGAPHISWQYDHGNLKGIEHFIKIASWAGFNELGERVIKAYCVDARMCGHSAEESAEAIKLVFDWIKFLLPNIISSSATTDSGGGGAMQYTGPLLKLYKVLPSFGKFNFCDLHGANNPLEIGFVSALGVSGIGRNTPTHLLFVYDSLMKYSTEELGRDNLNKIWNKIHKKLLHDERYRIEGTKLGSLMFTEFHDSIKAEDEASGEGGTKMAPANRRTPVLSRWLTVLVGNDDFLDHFFHTYFAAIEIKSRTSTKSGSLAHIYACKLLSLYRIKPEGDYVEESPPVFYKVLLFMKAFGEAFFLDRFNGRCVTILTLEKAHMASCLCIAQSMHM